MCMKLTEFWNQSMVCWKFQHRNSNSVHLYLFLLSSMLEKRIVIYFFFKLPVFDGLCLYKISICPCVCLCITIEKCMNWIPPPFCVCVCVWPADKLLVHIHNAIAIIIQNFGNWIDKSRRFLIYKNRNYKNS